MLFHAKVAIFADTYIYNDLCKAAIEHISNRWNEQGFNEQDTLEFVGAMSYIYETGDNAKLKEWFAEWAFNYFSDFDCHAAFEAVLRKHGDLAYAVCRFFNGSDD